MRVSNAMQIGVSGYFLAEEIVIYFKIKKCSEMLSCAAVGSRNRFSTAKSGFNLRSLFCSYCRAFCSYSRAPDKYTKAVDFYSKAPGKHRRVFCIYCKAFYYYSVATVSYQAAAGTYQAATGNY